MRKPWVIAHRGASGHAPENTLAAFERAVQLGAGFIETDIRMTRDAHFVAIHDDMLERTTNGRGGGHPPPPRRAPGTGRRALVRPGVRRPVHTDAGRNPGIRTEARRD